MSKTNLGVEMALQSKQREQLNSSDTISRDELRSPSVCRFSLSEYGIVFCVALATRMLHILSLKASPIFFYKIGDAAKYDAWARNLAAGNWIGEGVFYQAPLYPYFLGLVYKFIGDDILTVRRVQAFLGAVSCLLIMKTAGNLFGKRSGIIAGLILSCYAPSIFLEGLIQKSILDLFFLSLLLFLFTRSLLSKHFGYWIWIGIATGALCLTRENALVLLPVLALWIAFGFSKILASASLESPQIRWPTRVVWAAAFGFGLCLVLGPVVVRNYKIGGQLHLTTSQLGPNFYIGNNPNANGTYQPLVPGRGDAKFEQQDAIRLAEQAEGRMLSPKEVSKHYLAKSFAYINQQPKHWLTLMCTKTAMTFNSTELIDTEDQYTAADWSPVLRITNYGFHFGTLVPLALLGLYSTRKQWRSLWLVYLMAAAFALTVIAFFVFGRYRFPLAPILILFAAAGLIFLWDEIKLRQWKSVTCSVVSLIALFAVCNVEITSQKVGRGVTLSNYGVQAMIRSDYENAEQFLTTAYELLPNNHLIHNNLGVLYRETDRYDLAILHFKIAAKIEPNDEKARTNLAKLVTYHPANSPRSTDKQ